jgi:hypothetical protein
MVDRDSGAGSISLANDKKLLAVTKKLLTIQRCERPLGEEVPNWLGSLGVRNYQGVLSTRQIRLTSLGKVIEWLVRGQENCVARAKG